MKTQIFHAQLSVEEVLKKWPQTIAVFKKRSADCVGCILQKFCTLYDVAETHQFELQDFTAELEKCVTETSDTTRRTL